MRRICLSLLFFLTGCSQIPMQDFFEVPEDVIEKAVEEASNSLSFQYGQILQEDWWILFKDDQLTRFILRGLARHPNIAIAQARFRAAAFSADRVHAGLFPQWSLKSDYSRWRQSATGLLNSGPIKGQLPLSYWQPEASINIDWLVDFWGKNRSAFLAAAGEAQALIAEEASARIALSIAIAQVYFQMQTNLARQNLFHKLVANRKENVQLTELRVQNRIDNEFTLVSVKTDFLSAQEALTEIELDIELNRNALRSLLADDLNENEEPVDVEFRHVPSVPVPLNIQTNLLRFRPDVTATLWRVEAAAREVDVAVKDFYPNISITGFWGFQTIKPHLWFDSNSHYMTLGPALSLPIFDAGLRTAVLQYNQEEYIVAVQQYDNAVLNAVKEVMDAIIRVRKIEEVNNQVDQIVANQKNLIDLTFIRRNNKLYSNIEVFNAEKDLYTAQDRQLIAENNKIQAILSLIQSIGGGYEASLKDCEQ